MPLDGTPYSGQGTPNTKPGALFIRLSRSSRAKNTRSTNVFAPLPEFCRAARIIPCKHASSGQGTPYTKPSILPGTSKQALTGQKYMFNRHIFFAPRPQVCCVARMIFRYTLQTCILGSALDGKNSPEVICCSSGSLSTYTMSYSACCRLAWIRRSSEVEKGSPRGRLDQKLVHAQFLLRVFFWLFLAYCRLRAYGAMLPLSLITRL